MAGTTKLMTPGGGGVSLTPASSIASDVTVNVPSQNCTLDIQGPAFSAYASASQNTTSTVLTKVILNVEDYDTASCFDSVSNYRFTPNVAGYYRITAAVGMNGASTNFRVFLYKNGSLYRQLQNINTMVNTLSGAITVYLNGSTDFVEIYAAQSGGTGFYSVAAETWATGELVRAA